MGKLWDAVVGEKQMGGDYAGSSQDEKSVIPLFCHFGWQCVRMLILLMFILCVCVSIPYLCVDFSFVAAR